MAKYNSRLSKKEVEQIFYQLCLAISETKGVKEAAELLRDLLSFQEAEMIAKRLKIAEFLINGLTYQEISKNLKVGQSTIARIQEWLRVSGEGYRQASKVIKNKKPEKRESFDDYYSVEWKNLKKRYPIYFWPEILLENIIQNASKKQKEQIKIAIKEMEKMKEKNRLYYQLKKVINF